MGFSHLPLVEMLEEPVTVNERSYCQNWQSNKEVPESLPIEPARSLPFSKEALVDHDLDPSERGHEQARNTEHKGENAGEGEVDRFTDLSVEILLFLLVLDAVVKWPEDVGKQAKRRRHYNETTVILVILVARNGLNYPDGIQSKLHF